MTEAAQAVVAEAVKTAKANGFARVHVTGHTDTAESNSMNLSINRAQAVKSELIRDGFAAAGITIDGKGFHELLVPTAMGVKEPQNRRAVIDLCPPP